MPGTPASAQPVRVEYVPKSQRKAQGSVPAPKPKPAPPKVEPMPESLAAEFGDFDDGPAKIVEPVVVEAKVVADTTGAAAAAAGEAGGKKGGSRKGSKGSRKRKGSRK